MFGVISGKGDVTQNYNKTTTIRQYFTPAGIDIVKDGDSKCQRECGEIVNTHIACVDVKRRRRFGK